MKDSLRGLVDQRLDDLTDLPVEVEGETADDRANRSPKTGAGCPALWEMTRHLSN